MPDLSLFLEPLKSRIRSSRICFPEIPEIHGIFFLEGKADLEQDYLYIGETSSQTSWLLESSFEDPVTVFLDGDGPLSGLLLQKENLNIIHTDMGIFSLYNRLNPVFLSLVSRDQTLPSSRSMSAFSALLSDLLEERLTDRTEIEKRFRQLPNPPEKYVYCMIIDCPDMSTEGKDLLRGLKELLPGISAALFEEQIVAMLSAPEHYASLPEFLDLEALNALLAPSKAAAVVSCAVSHYEKFITLYRLCHRMLYLLSRMKLPSEYGAVYSYSDHAVYLAIDFCSQYYQTFTGHADIILLANPAIVKLMRYDRIHKTDLCDVLFYYLRSGRSAARTARELYMHRNTVLNKLNRIHELIHLPLEDGRTQQSLLFSCQIVRYYTRVLAQELV